MANIQTEDSIPDVHENVPNVGTFYDTLEQAYDTYNDYARRVGFSVRRAHTAKDVTGTYFRAAKLTCSREGTYHQKTTPTKKRDDTRCGCNAMFRVRYSNDTSRQVDNATMSQPTVDVIPDLNDALPDLNAYQPPMTSWTMATNFEVPSQHLYASQNQYVSEHSYANQQSYAPPTHQEPLGSNVNYGQPWFDASLTQESYFGKHYYGSNQDGGDDDNNNNFN